MAVPTLPADGDNPWGATLRAALVDISNRADQGISDAAVLATDLDDVADDVTQHGTTLTNHGGRITTLETTIATKANDNVTVKTSGNQTIAGTKTFSSAPVVPDNAFSIAKVSNLQTTLNAKAPISSPTFTGTVSGITKSMVGLANVDNTTDLSKPISTATQSALDTKADTSDLTNRIQTHNHTGGANGLNLPISAVTNLSGTLNTLQSLKEDKMQIAAGTSGSTVVNTDDFAIEYMSFYRVGRIAYVLMSITAKFPVNAGGSGNIGNKLICTINASSQFGDIYQGHSNSNLVAIRYPLSSYDGMMATGAILSNTREILLTATAPYDLNSGYTFSLGGMFLLNSSVQ